MIKPVSVFLFLGSILLLFFTLFWQLEKLPIQLWDESRNVTNALEMYGSGNYFVTYFESSPDMWNTKPPLLLWLQVICLKIIGVRELAFRLPTALAGLMTALSLFFWYKKKEDNIWKGWAAMLILVSTVGYVHIHCTRTGDYDALMIFWVMAALLTFYHFLQSHKYSFFVISVFMMALAALTKGVQAYLVMPFMFIFWLFQSKDKKKFFIQAVIYLFIALFPLFIYYLYRDSINPGYFQAVMDNELGGRFLRTLEEHKLPWYFYLQHHFNTGTKFWFPLAIIAFVIYLFNTGTKKISGFATYLLFIIVGYHLIIAMSQTKLDWYGNTLYPLYALFIVEILFTFWKDYKVAIVLGLISIFPLYLVIKNNYDFLNLYEDDSCHTAKILQQELKNHTLRDSTKIIAYGYVPHVKYYIYVAAKKGIYTPLVEEKDIKEGDMVITHRSESIQEIVSKYTIKEFRGYKTAKKFIVLPPAHTPD